MCAVNRLTTQVVARERVEDTYIVHARVTGPDGRSTDNMGAVPLASLKGEALANAMMKATTKAIRRTVLAHCGLGMFDDTEVDATPNAARVDIVTGEVTPPAMLVLDPRPDTSDVDPDRAIDAVQTFINRANAGDEPGILEHWSKVQKDQAFAAKVWDLLKANHKAAFKVVNETIKSDIQAKRLAAEAQPLVPEG